MKVCVATSSAARRLDEMPLDLDDLAAVRPIYEDLPGWPEVDTTSAAATAARGVSSPANARAFIDRVAELVGDARLGRLGRTRPRRDHRAHDPFVRQL